MKTIQSQPEQFGPFVPWPHIEAVDLHRQAFNPAREQRGPNDHQADCQRPREQAS